jgi:hypothetical protein
MIVSNILFCFVLLNSVNAQLGCGKKVMAQLEARLVQKI